MPKRIFTKRRRAEKRRARVETLCGLAVTAVIALLYLSNAFRPLELSVFDGMFRMRRAPDPDPEVVIIELDQETVDGIDKWPVPRGVYTRLLKILARAGARAVGFNIMFTENSSPEADAELAEAIAEAGMVYLPYYLKYGTQEGGVARCVDNIDALKKAARGEGHINMPPDPDGVTRRAILEISFDGATHRQFAFRMACDRLGVSPAGITRPSGRLAMVTAEDDGITIPVDAHGAMLIDWYGRWRERFTVYTVSEILRAGKEAARGDALPGPPLDDIKGCICLVGLTVPGAFDAMMTPFDQYVPSIVAHAAVISQILQRRFIVPESRATGLALIVAIGLCVSFLFPHLRPAAGAVVILLACVLYLLFAALMFFRFNRQTAVLYPLAALVLVYVARSVQHGIEISRERSRLLHLATHDSLTDLYVVGQVRLLLAAGIMEAQRQGTALAVVMADIDHFKKINDEHGHQAGDEILKKIAGMLTTSCRELDVVGRYGGEEFIMLLPGTGVGDAQSMAERVRRTIEARVFSSRDGGRHAVTVSLGVAGLSVLDTVEDLIRRADEALYEAKRAGRNCVRVKEKKKGEGKPITLG